MKELDVALEAAALASAVTRRDFLSPSGIEAKGGDLDIVTATDKRVEKLLVEHLQATFPAHRILGEESAEPPWNLDTGTIWVLDPVCGTESFAFGIPVFCTNILLLQDGEPVLAVVAEGLRDELVYAVRNRGTHLLRSGGGSTSLRGFVTQSTVVGFDSGTSRSEQRMGFSATVLAEIARRNRYSLRVLATSASLPMEARGVLAGNIFDAAYPWDLGAGALLCEEAGHVVTTHDGEPWRPDGSGIVAGRDAATHQELLECVRAHSS